MLGILVGMDQKDRYAFSCCSHAHCVQRQVPWVMECRKTAEFPQLLSIQLVDISFVVQRPIPMVLVTMEILQLRVDTVVDGPFVLSCSSLS